MAQISTSTKQARVRNAQNPDNGPQAFEENVSQALKGQHNANKPGHIQV